MPIWRKEHELARTVVHYIGMIVTAVAGSAFCGYIAKQPSLYQWGQPIGMALPTSMCLILTGIALFLVSRGEATHAGEGR